MELLSLGIGEVAELGTQVAMHGTLRAGEMMADGVFDTVVAVAKLIHALYPTLR